MKQCTRCQKTYTDNGLNFCLDDGEILTQMGSSSWQDDSPPTVVMDNPRVTNPTDWASSPPPAPLWQQNAQIPSFAHQYVAKRDQTLPTIAMILGILSLPLICCYGGFWLGLPAAVLGFMGMRNSDRDPQRYGGRGLAIAGMIMGAISFLASIVVAIVAIIANA